MNHDVDSNDIRQQCLEFAASHPTPAVRQAVLYAQRGAITWGQVYELFHKAMSEALKAV